MAPFLYICCQCEVSDDNPGPATKSRVARREPSRARRTSHQRPGPKDERRASHHHHRQNALPASMQASTVRNETQDSSHTVPATLVSREEHGSKQKDNKIANLQAQIQLEDLHYNTRTAALRQQIRDERVRHRARGTTLQGRLAEIQTGHHADIRERSNEGKEERIPVRLTTKSHIVKWLENLRSWPSSHSDELVGSNVGEAEDARGTSSTGTARQAAVEEKVEGGGDGECEGEVKGDGEKA